MVKPLSASELREQFELVKPWFGTHPGRASVIHSARVWAKHFQDATVWKWVNALPAARVTQQFGATNPDARDPDFNSKIEGFLIAADAALVQRENLERKIAANADLAPQQCEAGVLEYLSSHRGIVHALDLHRELALSTQQLSDALHDLHSVGALQGPGFSKALDGSFGWAGELSSFGRKLARGEVRAPAPSVSVQIHNSNVGAAGVIHGNVEQNVNPDVAEVVAALQALRDAGGEEPDAASAVAIAAAAGDELQQNGWSAKARNLLSTLGGAVRTVAALKPAYQTVQAIAAIHGVPLPLWP